MDELLSEKEQIEAIRSWWRENGRYVISGIVIGVGLLFGWNYWNDRQRATDLDASSLYEKLLSDVADSKVAPAEEKAASINSEFADTAYALQARLAMSRMYMDLGRDEDAAEQLRQLLAADGSAEMEMVARLRLGKILMYQDKPGEVIDLLEGHRETAFAARYSETLGDAYVAEGRVQEASEAYSAALADNPNLSTVDRTLIQMKIYDLPALPESDDTSNEDAPGVGTPPGGEGEAGAGMPRAPAVGGESRPETGDAPVDSPPDEEDE